MNKQNKVVNEEMKMINSYEATWEARVEAKRDKKELEELGYEYGKDFKFVFDAFTQKNYLYFGGM